MENDSGSDTNGSDTVVVSRGDLAIQAVKVDEEQHEICLNIEDVKALLQDPEISDKPVVVISVAGTFRKGKSFLLNFFIKYLQERADRSKWLADKSALLKGFHWRGGSDRDTTGILLWSEPFKMKAKDGTDVVVLLMDTQGAFDQSCTVKDCATIFALSTMVSSIQVYNLSGNIQEDDLQHLQLFTDYGRVALAQDETHKPFQNLVFMVRDWQSPYEYAFGYEGGQKLLDKRLVIGDKQHAELQSVRKHIKECFSSVSAFLMPHPGKKVASSPEFQGKLDDIDDDFLEFVDEFVSKMLSPENLAKKKISGQTITASELVYLFEAYTKVFQGDSLPEPKSVLIATAEANNLVALQKAKLLFTAGLEEVCGGDRPFVNVETINILAERLRNEALDQFKHIKKLGGDIISSGYFNQLETFLEEERQRFLAHNDAKNLMREFRTPAVLMAFLFVIHIVAGTFDIVGFTTPHLLCNILFYLGLIAISFWAYVKFSGHYTEYGRQLDEATASLSDWSRQNLAEYGPPMLQQMMPPSQNRAAAVSKPLSSSSSTSSPKIRHPKAA